MRLNEIEYRNARPVDGYGTGFFRIGGQVYQGGVLLLGEEIESWNGYEDTTPLTSLAGRLDVLFIGTGSEIAHIPASLRRVLEAADIPFEIMDSPAAARTYNVLLSEGRRIAAALLPVT